MNIYSTLESSRDELKKMWLKSMALPMTFTAIGLGAITLAIVLAQKEVNRIAEENVSENPEVENYDLVADKPFMYAICE